MPCALMIVNCWWGVSPRRWWVQRAAVLFKTWYMISDTKRRDNSCRMCSGFSMIGSGTKVTKVHLSQSTACVGQVKLAGERVPLSYGGERALPHFPKLWRDPLARAFVRHSFIDGLDPLETYFHAMGGREGLVDT